VHTKFVELKRPTDLTLVLVSMRTSGGRRDAVIFADRRHPQGDLKLWFRRQEERRCRTSHEINYGTNTLNVQVPRRCLGNPSWVQFRGVHETITGRTDTFDISGSSGSLRLPWVTERLRRG